MLNLGADYVDKLNSQYQGGKFIKAVIVTEDPVGPVLKYWADHEEPITFQGNTYTPLHMVWNNIKTSQSMPIEGSQITVSNLGGQAVKYLKELDISGNTVRLQLLHLDLLNSTTVYWQRIGKIIAAQADINVVTFTVGRQLGKNYLPRKVFLQSEFPGLISEQPKIFG